MQGNKYWEDRIINLKSELAALTKESKLTGFSSQEWDKFGETALPRLKKAYEKICDQVRHKLFLTGRLGRYTLNGPGEFKKDLAARGTIRLVAFTGQYPSGLSSVLCYPVNANEFKYSTLSIRPDARRHGAAFLSFDYLGIFGFSLCYRDGVVSAKRIKYKRPGADYDVTDVIEEVLHETSEGLVDLLNQYEALVFGQLRHDKTAVQIEAVKAKLAMAERCSTRWGRVHLPEDVLEEIFQTMEAFTSRDSTVGSVLLRGVPGTGKTFLAANIADSLGVKFITTGIQLKKKHLGHSAEAVQDLWKEARANKPCVIYVEECDGVLAQRDSEETDKIVAEITNAFLTEWNGKEPGIWMIASTNRPEAVDRGIISRFATHMEIPLPDAKARQAILIQELLEQGYSGKIPENLGSLTQGMSGRNLSQFAMKAAKKPSGVDWTTLLTGMRTAGNGSVDPDATWNSLIVSPETMDQLKTICSTLRDVEAWRARGVRVSNGILLEGPPGVGKTQVARTLANESGLSFCKATTADIRDPHPGTSALRIKNIFERARAMSPSILFIDELDILAKSRSIASSNDPIADEIIGQLLQEMSGIKTSSSHVFVLAATNHRAKIDPAILDRFMETLYIELPDLDARVQLLNVMLKAAKVTFPSDEVYVLAGFAEGMSGRHMENWMAKAQQKAISRAIAAGGVDQYNLTVKDFAETVTNARDKVAVN